MQLRQLLVRDVRWRPGEETAGLLGFGEGNGVADRFLASQEHHHAIQAKGDAAVGRGSHVDPHRNCNKLSATGTDQT